MKKDALLSIAGVSFRYGPQIVLKDIDLDVERGEVIGIIGPNGAGKSTLLKLIAGYLSPDKGSIMLSGRPLGDYSRRTLAKHIATLPQTLDMPFPYTVEEFIVMGRYPYDRRSFSYGIEEKEVVLETMNALNIGHLAGRQINALSEGERQKVYLAQCIVQDPGILLLDEPVSHLDIRHQMRVLEILENLQTKGLTILMILHDLNLASEFCSRIVLIARGSIYASGLPAATLTYENIEKAYDTVVIVRENPLSKKPFIIPVSRKYLKADNEKP